MKGKPIRYSKAELRWLERNRTLPIADYHRAFCARFHRRLKPENLHSLRKRMGWRSGRTGQFCKGGVPANKGKKCKPGTGGLHPNARKTQFKKGGLPHNTHYLGHERASKDGYIEISIDETNPHTGFERRYVLKHRWLWEQTHGPIPKGMALKCKGDKTNCDPSNWELIPRGVLPRLSGRFGRGYDQAPAELKPTIMAVAKLEQQLHEKTKQEST
jgi:hypothetical protein